MRRDEKSLCSGGLFLFLLGKVVVRFDLFVGYRPFEKVDDRNARSRSRPEQRSSSERINKPRAWMLREKVPDRRRDFRIHIIFQHRLPIRESRSVQRSGRQQQADIRRLSAGPAIQRTWRFNLGYPSAFNRKDE